MRLLLSLMCFVFSVWVCPAVSVAFELTITPRLSLTEEYTDNIFLISDDAEDLGIEKEDDYISIISTGLTAEILGRNKGAALSYDPSWSFYKTHDDLNSSRQSAQISGWYTPGRTLRIDITDRYTVTEDTYLPELSDLAGEAGTVQRTLLGDSEALRRTRQEYATNSARIGITKGLGRSSSLNVSLAHNLHDEYDNYDEINNILLEDNESFDVTVGYEYTFDTINIGFATELGYTRGEFYVSDEDIVDLAPSSDPGQTDDELDYSSDFDHCYVSLRLSKHHSAIFESFMQYAHTIMAFEDTNEEDYQIYDTSVGFNYVVREEYPMSVSIGYFKRDMEEGGRDTSGVTVAGDLGRTWTFRYGEIGISASSGYRESYIGADTDGFSKFYGFQGEGHYMIIRNLTGHISGSFRNDDFPSSDTTDKTTIFLLGFTYVPLEWVNIRFEVSRRSVDSNNPDSAELVIVNDQAVIDPSSGSYNENRALLGITLTPGHSFRIH